MKHLIILGGGESGVGAALLAQKHGVSVFVSDSGMIKKRNKETLIEKNIPFEEWNHNEPCILSADEIIKSPGIPNHISLMRKIYEKKIPVISEIEFASRYNNAKIIAITGSNGKTTTSLLTYHILKQGGINVALVGNIGHSFARHVAQHNPDYYVLEMSSFQLEHSPTFRPKIAIFLNITPDHLNRYDYNMDKYINSKFKICLQQTEKDFFIYNYDDPVLQDRVIKTRNLRAHILPFSIKDTVNMAAYLENQILHINFKKKLFYMITSSMTLTGDHNLYNLMAAGLAARVIRIRKECLKNSLSNFKSVEHRLEKVLKIQDIWFINDSKSTNVHAAFSALKSIQNPIIWIAGGQDKGNDYSQLIIQARKKVKGLICLGLDNHKLIETFYQIVDVIIEVQNMKEAVRHAYIIGQRGDVILLSPACSSFDLFKNYEDRGRQFKEEVANIFYADRIS